LVATGILAVIYEIRLTFGGRLAAELGWRRVRARESGCFAVQIIAQRRQRINLRNDAVPLRVPAGVPQLSYLCRESGAEIVGYCDYPLKEN